MLNPSRIPQTPEWTAYLATLTAPMAEYMTNFVRSAALGDFIYLCPAHGPKIHKADAQQRPDQHMTTNCDGGCDARIVRIVLHL